LRVLRIFSIVTRNDTKENVLPSPIPWMSVLMQPNHSLNYPVNAFYLTGPTASGKSAVGLALAERLDAEIVALDSMTLYRGMDIGTAKPTARELARVPHHIINMLDPWESASVAQYRRWALAAAGEIKSRGKRVLFVGGTPLYLKALLRGLFEGPGADDDLRRKLEAEAETLGAAALHDRLAKLDPPTAERLHPNDRRRIIRALEVVSTTGQPLSAFQTEHDRPAQNVPVVALERPRPELHDRINLRVLDMFAQGLVDEVRGLQAGPQPLSSVAAQGVGYKETIAHLEGRSTLPQAIELVQARTRQFAKRQATWFRGLEEVRPWPVATDESPDETAERLSKHWLSSAVAR
jgi:tRNA dimethylallyltransferase